MPERLPENLDAAAVAQPENEVAAVPAWLESIVDWVSARRRTLLAAGFGVQLIVLVGMIVCRMMLLWRGETVLLRVVPVDPRDAFRGDYVALRYEISQIPPGSVAGLSSGGFYDSSREGKTVYATLVPEKDGKHWRAASLGVERPKSGRFIRGEVGNWGAINYGIESYYVQEGEGHRYEQAVRDRRLSAEVALTPDGRAALRGLRIEAAPDRAAATAAGPTYEAATVSRLPTDAVYRVRRLPRAQVRIDGRLDEREWSRANAERHFIFPWSKAEAAATEFMAFCDDQFLYFAYRVEDADIFVLDKLRDKEDAVFEDRVEMILCRDEQMHDYFCFEIDSRGRVFDYRASYYRQFDPKWKCKGLETAAAPQKNGYAVEGRIPLATLVEMGFPRLAPGEKILCGLYRAEFSHDRSGKPVVQRETIHNRGRKLDGPPPLEEWMSWVDPQTPEPDFHVPSSLGWLEIVE